MKLLLVLLLGACGDNEIPDDGFGTPCESIIDGRLYTTCETVTGAQGICAIGMCRRFCNGREDAIDACPEGQRAIPTVMNLCWCEPCPAK